MRNEHESMDSDSTDESMDSDSTTDEEDELEDSDSTTDEEDEWCFHYKINGISCTYWAYDEFGTFVWRYGDTFYDVDEYDMVFHHRQHVGYFINGELRTIS